MKKFIKLRILSIAEDEEAKIGFSDEAKKKKKRKPKPIAGELILAIDAILSVTSIKGDIELNTVDGTYLLADNIEKIKKLLKVKR